MRTGLTFAALCILATIVAGESALRGVGKLETVKPGSEAEWRYVSTNHPKGKGQVEDPSCGGRTGKDCRKVAVETGCLGFPCEEMKAVVGKVAKEGGLEVVPRSDMRVHRVVHEKEVPAAPTGAGCGGTDTGCEEEKAPVPEKDVVVSKTAACEEEPCEATVRVETTKEVTEEKEAETTKEETVEKEAETTKEVTEEKEDCGDACSKTKRFVVVSTTDVPPCEEKAEEATGCGAEAAAKAAAKAEAKAEETEEEEEETEEESAPCECAEGHPDTRCCAKARASVEEHLVAGKVKAVEKLAEKEASVSTTECGKESPCDEAKPEEETEEESAPCECAEGHPDTRCCAKARASVEEHLVAGKVKAVEKLAEKEAAVEEECADCPKNGQHAKALLVAARARVMG